MNSIGVSAAEESKRSPNNWFERLGRHQKLNDAEFLQYAEHFMEFGLAPDPSVHETWPDKTQSQANI